MKLRDLLKLGLYRAPQALLIKLNSKLLAITIVQKPICQAWCALVCFCSKITLIFICYWFSQGNVYNVHTSHYESMIMFSIIHPITDTIVQVLFKLNKDKILWHISDIYMFDQNCYSCYYRSLHVGKPRRMYNRSDNHLI